MAQDTPTSTSASSDAASNETTSNETASDTAAPGDAAARDRSDGDSPEEGRPDGDAPEEPISTSRYTQVIDLTSKAQRAERREKTGSLKPPAPELDEITADDLPDVVEQAFRATGWSELMEVQRTAIPYMLDRRDIIVQARTGSGKTGAFLLPLFNVLDPERRVPQALILAPTRELARQIHEEFERMKIATPDTNEFDAALLYGGVSYGPQLEALENGAQVVIGTPGRTLDHLNQGNFKAGDVQLFILDEADEMLSMGFYPDMKEIEEFLPEKRQSLMFSATMPPKIQTLAREFLRDPGFLALSSGHVSVETINYRYYLVSPMEKDRSLKRLIDVEEPESSIIFANTKREVSYLTQFLTNEGYDAEEMSGDLSQKAREKAMGRLRDGKVRFLVATDVAARGIDISDLSHVFVYDVPQDEEYLIHRSGRTARAGKQGTCIILATHEDEFKLKRMARRYDIDMERAEVPTDPLEDAIDLLDERYRQLDRVTRDRVQEMESLVPQIAERRPELLAQFIEALRQDAEDEEE
jgi:ATP-dependent RNA helicase DeaD